MKEKKRGLRLMVPAALCLAIMTVSTCASPAKTAPGALLPADAAAADTNTSVMTLDQAIADIAAYFAGRLPPASHIAITGFEADTENLSGYTAEELWNHFEQAGAFVMVDRQNLEKIREEINYQMSGEVSDESARSIGKQFGVQYIIYGRVSRIGEDYRVSAYATDVEKASSSLRALTIRPDGRLNGLVSDERGGVESEIDRAVIALGRSLAGPVKIGVGRISLNGTGTVTSLSAYLKRNISHSASQQRNKYEVVDDKVSNEYAVSRANLTRDIFVETGGASTQGRDDTLIQGVVEGDFSPLGGDAAVTLRLVSAVDNRVLGSSRFVIPAVELSRRELSLYPGKDGGAVIPAEFEAKQEILAPYSGRDNAFGFTVKGDDLDGIYYEDEYMTMRLYAEQDCYFKILQVNVRGDAQVLYPRSAKDDNSIKAGQTRRIPDNTRFRITPPFGEEYILAAAYARPFDIAAGPAVPLSSSGLSRDIMVEDEETRLELRPLAAAKFSYTTLPR
jgi:TolB-like protein